MAKKPTEPVIPTQVRLPWSVHQELTEYLDLSKDGKNELMAEGIAREIKRRKALLENKEE